jgi:thioredoxin-related protein
MNRTRQCTLVAVIALLFAGCAAQGREIWTENFEEAKALAAKDGKDLLLEFTGSDWCPYCIELRQKVFDTPEFKKEAPKSFVLVELDFPNNVKQSDQIRQQNAQLAETYGVGGYPTMVLTDAKGEPYAQVGYNGQAEQVVPKLIGMHNHKAHRDELLAKANKTTGVEKAQILDEVIHNKLSDEILPQYDDILDQIVAADSENKAGIKAKYETRVELRPIIAGAQAGDIPGAIAKLEDKLKEKGATALRKQEIMYMKAILLQFSNQAVESLATLKEARDQDPKSDRGKEIAGILAQIEPAQK